MTLWYGRVPGEEMRALAQDGGVLGLAEGLAEKGVWDFGRCCKVQWVGGVCKRGLGGGCLLGGLLERGVSLVVAF